MNNAEEMFGPVVKFAIDVEGYAIRIHHPPGSEFLDERSECKVPTKSRIFQSWCVEWMVGGIRYIVVVTSPTSESVITGYWCIGRPIEDDGRPVADPILVGHWEPFPVDHWACAVPDLVRQVAYEMAKALNPAHRVSMPDRNGGTWGNSWS